ncbi:MAG: GDP-L-fucose synthase family protein [Bdellovibrio sp.]
MNKNAKIYVAGHRGFVGSAMVEVLKEQGFTNLVLRPHSELDLMDQDQVVAFFEQEKPEYVFMAAAKVGGILANNTYPADFIFTNTVIQNNIIENSHKTGVKRLLFLGSSCIYPKEAPQPIKEESLLTGPLEPTNRPYAIAKISGIEMCWSFNRQYETKYLVAMPTNLYGVNDNYDLKNSHVIPALMRKFHEAKVQGAPQAVIWGTGKPLREFMNSKDMAEACVFLMNLPEEKFNSLVAADKCPLINVGVGHDISIKDLATMICKIVGYKGELVFDETKPDGTFRKVMDCAKLHALGWKHHIELEQGLTEVYSQVFANKP